MEGTVQKASYHFKADLVAYLNDSIQSQIPLLQLNWEQLSVLVMLHLIMTFHALGLEIGINEGHWTWMLRPIK